MGHLSLFNDDVDPDPEGTIDAFAGSPEGRRVLQAAEQMASLELRDEHGRLVPCDSMLVSDLHEMVALGAQPRIGDGRDRDPIRYIISATFSTRAGSQRSEPGPH